VGQAVDLTDDDLGAMSQILQAAFLEVMDCDLASWEANVGHNSLWYSGFKLWARDRLKVVAAGRGEATSVPSKKELVDAGVYAKLRLCHAAGQCLHKSSIPRSIGQYQNLVTSLRSELSNIHPPGLNSDGDYSIPWIIRSHVFAELRSRGISKLNLDDTSLGEIRNVFPDSKDWLGKFARKKGLASFAEICHELEFKHPPELLTMYCCLFSENTVMSIAPASLAKHIAALRRARRSATVATGVVPVPALLVKRVAASAVQSLRQSRARKSHRLSACRDRPLLKYNVRSTVPLNRSANRGVAMLQHLCQVVSWSTCNIPRFWQCSVCCLRFTVRIMLCHVVIWSSVQVGCSASRRGLSCPEKRNDSTVVAHGFRGPVHVDLAKRLVHEVVNWLTLSHQAQLRAGCRVSPACSNAVLAVSSRACRSGVALLSCMVFSNGPHG
jgi:hypothetical protein